MPHNHYNRSKNNIKIQTKPKSQLVIIKNSRHTEHKSSKKSHERHVIRHNKPYKYCEDETEYDSPEFSSKF